jgi:hypothetical protein
MEYHTGLVEMLYREDFQRLQHDVWSTMCLYRYNLNIYIAIGCASM